MSVFRRFPRQLQEAIVARLGWRSLRPVQEMAGEAILDGKNAVVLAPTAGGKTEASIFPVLAGLLEHPPEGVGALYVAPIKALLNNQEERLGTYTEMVGLSRFVWHGDTSDAAKKRFLKEPSELLMTTPESLEVMLLSPRVPVARLFRDLRVVVIDEVHAFAGSDRGAHLASVLERLVAVAGGQEDLQRVGLSATVGNPHEILRWLQGTSRRAGEVIDPPKAAPHRTLSISSHPSTLELAEAASARALGKKTLFFCQSRSVTELVAERMRDRGMEVFVHHSSVALEARRAAEERFASGTNACIVCTSTLELGIDVGDLDLVFQVNAPSSVSSFLQRMGRTGRRAGAAANTAFFCDQPGAVLQAVALIELAQEGWVEPVAVSGRCWPVLVHQLLAMTLQFGAVSAERCREQLAKVEDFKGISRAEFGQLIDHMKREDFLFEAGGLLSMGQKAERAFGRKNFMELYAVFSSPQLYRVQSPTGADIGSLEQAFVDSLVEEMSSFLLGGRAWTVDLVNHGDRIVRVRPAPRGKKPAWGGFVPQMLGFELCQRMRQILASGVPYPFLDGPSEAELSEERESLGPLLRRPGLAFQTDEDAVRLWTFAGGRINHTLKYALEVFAGWKVISDNVMLRIEGDGVSVDAVAHHLQAWSQGDFWRDEGTRRGSRPTA
jgi:ATP-dependent Lhr-like helicase